jgi:hypothetical protein
MDHGPGGYGFRDVYTVRSTDIQFGFWSLQRRSHFRTLCNSASWNGHVFESGCLCLPSLPSAAAQRPYLASSSAALPQPDVEPQAGMKRRKDFWLVVRPRLARRAPPIHAESQFEHTGCIPVRTPKPSVGCQNPTCRSGSPIDMLHALCPRLCLGIFLCLKIAITIASLHFCKKKKPIPHTSAIPGISPSHSQMQEVHLHLQ